MSYILEASGSVAKIGLSFKSSHEINFSLADKHSKNVDWIDLKLLLRDFRGFGQAKFAYLEPELI
jgi:hypothetical protein